jgi:voltage-gated potassium channel
VANLIDPPRSEPGLAATGRIAPYDLPMATTGDSEKLLPDERIARWEHRTLPIVAAAAILPMVQLFQGKPDWITFAIDSAAWLVFVIDLVVHIRIKRDYLKTRFGIFDLVIVFLTFPWTLLFPGSGALQSLAVVRLARLARVAVVALRGAPQLRTLTQRLGKAFLYVGIIVVTAALIEMRVEPESSGFVTFGDSLWWGAVTLTTVGYGDIVPVTTAGRIVGVVVMLVGLAFLGTVAGSLASFFGLGTKPPKSDDDVPASEPANA